MDHPERAGVVRIVDGLTAQTVVARQPPWNAKLVEEPGAEDDLEEVVGNEDLAQLEGLAVLHEPGAQHLDQVHVAQADR